MLNHNDVSEYLKISPEGLEVCWKILVSGDLMQFFVFFFWGSLRRFFVWKCSMHISSDARRMVLRSDDNNAGGYANWLGDEKQQIFKSCTFFIAFFLFNFENFLFLPFEIFEWNFFLVKHKFSGFLPLKLHLIEI